MDVVTLSAAKASARKTFQTVTERNVNGRGRVGVGQSNGTDTSQTSRLRFVIRGDVAVVRLVYQNFWSQSGANEPSNGFDVTVKASIENPALAAGDPTGAATIPVFFNGQRTGVMAAAGGMLVSDPIYVNVANGSPLWVRSSATVGASSKWTNNYVTQFTAGAGFDGGGVLEGVVANTDSVDSGTISGSSSNAFGPSVILGKATAATRKPSVLIAGDSIAIDTGIVTAGQVGYIARSCVNAGFPFLRVGEGAERALTVASPMSYWKRSRLAPYATHVICNYGTNDIFGSARTLAQVKADMLTLWTMWARMGLTVYQTTVLPRPTSTDGFMTVTGQTVQAAETVRTAWNSYLRDTSASGAVAQSGGTLKGVLDPCSAVEVNSSGVLTLNGGFWKSAGAVVRSGTATSFSASVVTDTGATRTVNADAGLTLAVTSASTGAPQSAQIASNTATAWTLLSSLSPTPTGTLGYQIGPSYCGDGIHPTEAGHILMGDALGVGSALSL